MELKDYTHGKEAAKIFGTPRADEVWRSIRRKGPDYAQAHTPIEIIRFNNSNMVLRVDLIAFTKWYRENVTAPRQPQEATSPRRQPNQPPATANQAAKNRLREAIDRIRENK